MASLSNPISLDSSLIRARAARPGPISTIVVHEFSVGAEIDVDLYMSQVCYNWRQTPAGKFVMEHAISMPTIKSTEWHSTFALSHSTISHTIIASMYESDQSFWRLKWGTR